MDKNLTWNGMKGLVKIVTIVGLVNRDPILLFHQMEGLYPGSASLKINNLCLWQRGYYAATDTSDLWV